MTKPETKPAPVALRWFRWRERWSAGPGNWGFVELRVATEDEALAELREQHDNYWSEHWRGIEVEEIDLPPRDYLERLIIADRDIAQSMLKRAARYELLLAETSS